jgi:hypothetical protein
MLQVLPYHQLMLETFLEGVMRRVEVTSLQEFFNLVIKQVKKVAILNSHVVYGLSIDASQRVSLMAAHQHILRSKYLQEVAELFANMPRLFDSGLSFLEFLEATV